MSEGFGYAAPASLSDNWELSDRKGKPADSSALDSLVAGYLRAAHADNTRRAYAADLRHFVGWGGTLPSSPDDIARYLAAHADTLNTRTLRRRLAALADSHRAAGAADPTKHPLIARLLSGIEHRHRAPPRQATPLLIDDLARIVTGLGDNIRDRRDKALLLVGFFGALRRSELVALNEDAIVPHADSIEIQIRRSKTDQSGEGRRVPLARRDDQLCPVTALKAWMAIANVREGPVFRDIERGTRLSDRTVARVVKRRARDAKLDAAAFAGHSLRAGFATSAALAGADATLIARQTGHRSLQALATYVRPAAAAAHSVLHLKCTTPSAKASGHANPDDQRHTDD